MRIDRIYRLDNSQRMSDEHMNDQRMSDQPTMGIAQLGAYSPASNRRDPIATLIAQGETRVSALLPIRYSRMSQSAFAFYRGSAVLMANDLGPRPNSGLQVQLCGDAHLGNFGIFATADRRTIFDVNDFDETFPGPFEWDVQRMVTSFAIAAANRPEEHRDAIILAGAAAYRLSMKAFAAAPFVDTWYFRVDASSLEVIAKSGGLSESGMAEMNKGFVAAEKRDQWSAIKKLTVEVDGERQFINQPPLVVRLSLAAGVKEAINLAFDRYKETLLCDRQILLDHYRIVDFGHKVVGVGSVGLLAYIVLLQGRDANDLLVLQVKQAIESVLEPWVPHSASQGHGLRVTDGQRNIQAATDAFLGWFDGAGGKSFYVRQLRDKKWSPDVDSFKHHELMDYAHICGGALARAHARSGNAQAICDFIGTDTSFESAIADFAAAYTKQSASDHAEFLSAIASEHISTSGPDSISQEISLRVDGAFNVR
jgi:uncharacterized protein (DUF2252 family)